MATYTPLLAELIQALQALPGVGPKSAQRMAFSLLTRGRQRGFQLAESLQQAMDKIGHCEQCRNFSETPVCPLCQDVKRNQQQLCVVESPPDVFAMEQTGYRGRYYVLLGRLSPIDGIGPQELGLDKFKARLQQSEFKEIILATNPTVEGEATAHYLAQIAKQYQIPCSRLAHGIPVGGELEQLDSNTLSHAFTGREVLA